MLDIGIHPYSVVDTVNANKSFELLTVTVRTIKTANIATQHTVIVRENAP